MSGLALSFLHRLLNQKRDFWLPNLCSELGPKSRVRISGQDPHSWTGCCQVASHFQPLCYFPHPPKIPICNSAALFSPGAFPCFFHSPIPGCDGRAAGFSTAVIKRRCGASAREGEPKPLAYLRLESGRRACINGIIMCLFPEKKKECILCHLMTFKLTVL